MPAFSPHARRSSHLTLFALFMLLALALLPPARPARAQAPAELAVEGWLGVVHGDPRPGSGGAHVTIYTLRDDQGTTYTLSFEPGASLGPLEQLQGGRVRVTGAYQSAPGSYDELRVRGLVPAQQPGAPGDRVAPPGADREGVPAATDALSGSYPFAVLLCKFADKPALEPQNTDFFVGQFGNSYPGFGHYFRELSYGQINLDGTQVAGWYTLPKTEAEYGAMTSITMLTTIANDCTAAANADVNFTQFTGGVGLMLNGTLKNSAWGGRLWMTLDGVARNWPLFWMPYHVGSRFGWLEHGIVAHEMAHAFSSPHSGSSVGYEYGSSWDAVSNPQAHCGAVGTPPIHPTYGCIGQHVAAYNKQTMNIIPTGRGYTYTGNVPRTITLERLAQPAGTPRSYILATVPISGTANRFYVVEARWRSGYDLKLPADGVLIHNVDRSRLNSNPNAPVAWIEAPPGAAADALRCSGACGVGAANAVWPVGSTFANVADNVWIRVESFSATDGTARVTIRPLTPALDKAVLLPLVGG